MIFQGVMKPAVVCLIALSRAGCAHAFMDELQLINFLGPATSASAGMTALALSAGTKGGGEWFYLSDWSKSQAVSMIQAFEETTRVSLSSEKVPFFCSTILYMQAAAAAIQRDAEDSISAMIIPSISSTVSSLISTHPAATDYKGYCVQLFPSPHWRTEDAPCEGTTTFAEHDGAPGVSLFSLKCLASSDFDWKLISPGYRPGGVSALFNKVATVHVFSSKPICSTQQNSRMASGILDAMLQMWFTQLMVAPVAAMLTMDVKEVCTSGFQHATCLRFENMVDLFFESWNAAHGLAEDLYTDAMCIAFKADVDPFDKFSGR